MTTPVVTRKVQSVGEKMEMTTPVITSKVNISNQWIVEGLFLEVLSLFLHR